MITLQLTPDEIRFPIYLKEFGSSRLSIVRELAQRGVEQNNQLIQKLETLIGEGVPF